MSPSTPASRREYLLALALYGLLALFLTWPVVGLLGTELAGGRDDLWVHQWTFWWVREALRDGVSPFFTNLLYHPQGVALTSHNIAWFNIGAWLPLQALFGRTVAYNLVFLLVVALNGFCMFAFAREVVGERLPAFLAGFIFAFWPYTLSHFDHANMMVVFWVPLALLLLTRLILAPADGGWRWGLVAAAAVALAMIGITRWQLLIMSLPILVAYPLYLLGSHPETRSRQTAVRLIATATLALLLMAPLAAPLVIDQFTRDFPQDVLLDEAIWGRTDMLAYFIPSIHNSLWRRWVVDLYESFAVNQFYTPYLGYTTLALAAAGALKRWSQTWLWLALGVLYFVLALGPELAINGTAYPAVPMPYRLVEEWFVMQLIRRPDRLNVFLSLPLAMCAAWGMQALLARFATARGRWLATTAVLFLLLLAYWPVPFTTTALTLPGWYAAAAADGESYAVLDLPINDRSYDKWYMAYQTLHEKPLVTGHVSRLPREATTFLDSVPLLADLEARDQLPDPALTDISGQLALLHEAGIRYLVMHKQFANSGLQAAWREWLGVTPFHEDDQLLVFRTAPQYGQDFAWAYPLVESLGLIEAGFAPADAVQGGAVVADLLWGTAVAPPANYLVCLRLRDNQGQVVRRACQGPQSGVATSEWAANSLLRGQAVLTLPPDVPPAAYQLELFLAQAPTGREAGQAAVLGEVGVRPFAPQTRHDAQWDNGVRLLGSTLSASSADLLLELYWQATEPVVASYKVFVHLIDPRTGQIVAQSDGIPREWTYPTSAWLPGEIVRDPVRLPLSEIPPGRYEVMAGLYDETGGTRAGLPALGQDAFTVGMWEQP